MIVTDAMVYRFLSWPLPGHIKPDGVYPPRDAPYPMSGTNLLGFDEARAMLEHVLAEGDYPECSGDPACCPENEGFGCCKTKAALESAQSQTPPKEQGQRREITESDVLGACAAFDASGAIHKQGTYGTDAMRAVLEWYESTRAPQPHGASAGIDVKSLISKAWRILIDTKPEKDSPVDQAIRMIGAVRVEYALLKHAPTPSQPSCVQDARDDWRSLETLDIPPNETVLVTRETGEVESQYAYYVRLLRDGAKTENESCVFVAWKPMPPPAAITAKPGKGETK